MEKANRMPRRNGKDEQNAEEECAIKKANSMPRKNEEWIKQPECH